MIPSTSPLSIHNLCTDAFPVFGVILVLPSGFPDELVYDDFEVRDVWVIMGKHRTLDATSGLNVQRSAFSLFPNVT
jgi:hypothetical protein